MSASGAVASMARPLNWWQRIVVRMIPWLRHEVVAQDRRMAHTEANRLRGIRVRIGAEQVRSDYRKAAGRLAR